MVAATKSRSHKKSKKQKVEKTKTYKKTKPPKPQSKESFHPSTLPLFPTLPLRRLPPRPDAFIFSHDHVKPTFVVFCFELVTELDITFFFPPA